MRFEMNAWNAMALALICLLMLAVVLEPSARGEVTVSEGGTPEVGQTPIMTLGTGGVVINEVYPNPVGREPDGEWIELYNGGATNVSLYGWYIGDDVNATGHVKEGSYIFPQGTVIEAGGYLIVAVNGTAFYEAYGFYPDVEMMNTTDAVPDMIRAGNKFMLNNDGDDLHLFSPDGSEVDAVWYGTGGAMGKDGAARRPGEGESIERTQPGLDTDDPSSDFTVRVTPTPSGITVPELGGLWLIPLIAVLVVIYLFRRM